MSLPVSNCWLYFLLFGCKRLEVFGLKHIYERTVFIDRALFLEVLQDLLIASIGKLVANRLVLAFELDDLPYLFKIRI
jgi:hypothetical protein